MLNEPSQVRGGAPPPETDVLALGRSLTRSPLGGLAGASRDALLALATLERMPRRHLVAAEGEPALRFLLIGSGRIKVERSRAHHEGAAAGAGPGAGPDHALLLGHRGPGQMVGETALGGSPVATETATVVDQVEALSVPVAALRKQLAADAPLRVVLAAAIVRQQRELEERLAAFLLDAARRWGEPHPEGEMVSAPFTHAEIAHLIGSTRETVTLVLGKLRREGLVSFDRRRVVLRDRERLAQRAAAPPA
jgi:CRP-like cAMP-binding protein